jgi:tetratricopeptide (TPR) repeat protein
MKTPFTKLLGSAMVLSLAVFAPLLHGQATSGIAGAAVEGEIQDSERHPLPGAIVALEASDPKRTATSTSDSQGKFRFEAVPPGTYSLRASLPGYPECQQGPFVVRGHETKSVVLLLTKQRPSSTADTSDMAFSDEPSFTVAGVTDTTALGGHGSAPIARNSNALSKDAATLAKHGSSSSNGDVAGRESTLRAQLAREDNAGLRVQLAELEETEGKPLDAVRDYQRAVEMQPTEPHLFAWGAELLLHHAPEPAAEVFAKGHRLYPQSSRMMLGLGTAWYAQRSTEQAAQMFLAACDVDPKDPTPYLFLGKLQVTEQALPSGWTDRMKRFATLRPENATAHYLYAVSLMKSGMSAASSVAEAELNTAIKLDTHLGGAYLYLGILRTEREDFPGAIAALEKAIETTAVPEEAHYRLAQVYRRIGDAEKADQEIAQYKKLVAQRDEQAERERHEIQQFVYTLRNQNAQPAATPNPQ